MSLNEIPINSTIIESIKALGTIIAAASLFLGYMQLRANVRWNRLNATYSYLPETVYLERERAVAKILEPLKVDLYQQKEPLTDDVIKAIMENPNVFKEVKDFLNMFEDYATAYKAKAIDRNHACLLNATRYIRYFHVFKPFIEELRSSRKNVMYYWQFQWLVTKDWTGRQDKQAKRIEDPRMRPALTQHILK